MSRKLLPAFLKIKKGLLVDVGACHGGVTELFAKMNWNVVAFEPDPDNYFNLARKVENNSNVKLLQCAVSDRENEDIIFYSSDNSIGISSLSAFTSSHKPKCVVKVRTLAGVTKELGIETVDFLKVDAEGYDYLVLKGFNWNDGVEKFPNVIMCEFDDGKELPADFKYTMIDMAEFLKVKGYKIYVSEWYPIKHYGGNHAFKCLKNFPCETHKGAWGNIIAIKTNVNIEANEIVGAYKNYILKNQFVSDAKTKIKSILKCTCNFKEFKQ